MRRFADFHDTWDSNPSLWGLCEAIVTGTSWLESDKVLLEWVGPRKPVFFSTIKPKDYSTITVATHKADIINRCQVDVFYENELDQIDMLRILCPNCKIIHIKPEMTFI